MSKISHLITRNKQFYYFIRIPADLKQYFQCTFLKRSLKTSDKTKAKEDATPLEYQVSKTFRMLRSGLLSETQADTLVSDLLPKKRLKERCNIKLSEIMVAYSKEHERKWGHKSKLENLGSYKLIVDILGDMELAAITKQAIIDLRGKLELLPANMYKIYTKKTVKEILKESGITPMSITSVNKHMFRLSTVLKFAIREGHMQVNFAERMKIPQRRRPDEERKAYSSQYLTTMIFIVSVLNKFY